MKKFRWICEQPPRCNHLVKMELERPNGIRFPVGGCALGIDYDITCDHIIVSCSHKDTSRR